MNEPTSNPAQPRFTTEVSTRLRDLASPEDLAALRKVIADAEHGRHLSNLPFLSKIVEYVLSHPEPDSFLLETDVRGIVWLEPNGDWNSRLRTLAGDEKPLGPFHCKRDAVKGARNEFVRQQIDRMLAEEEPIA